ncbi:hypothetical protein F5883DRAFT_571160 [Diaporthe sp. PMI_573]|nr:hypothetical protein F5883DRAFT_571160 [Diaporthaceae sp. PMI_573]
MNFDLFASSLCSLNSSASPFFLSSHISAFQSLSESRRSLKDCCMALSRSEYFASLLKILACCFCSFRSTLESHFTNLPISMIAFVVIVLIDTAGTSAARIGTAVSEVPSVEEGSTSRRTSSTVFSCSWRECPHAYSPSGFRQAYRDGQPHRRLRCCKSRCQ